MNLERVMATCVHLAWIIALIVALATFGYERWHPCGLAALHHESMTWIERCTK